MSMRGESRCRCGEEPTGRTQVRYFLTEVMCRLRRGWNPSQLELNLRQADLYFEDVRLHHPLDVMRGSYLMPLVTLRTPSCGWSRTSGCTMCGYFLGSTGQRTTSPEELVEQTRWAIHRLDPRIYHTLVFTSNGSFLDPAEIPDAVRPELLRLLFGAGFRFIVVETRPGFVTSERLDAMLDVVPAIASGRDERSLSFSLGAESCSDFILSACVNKGIRARNLTESADLIRRKGFSLDCYVLLGKPFLSAREDVQDALETIRWAQKMGADYLFVMVTNRVAYSLVDHLISQGRHSLTNLWRAVFLLEMLPEELRRLVQIKGINHAPYPPKDYATTCPVCHDRVVQGINFWNQTGDFKHILELPNCPCRKQFEMGEWAEISDRLLPQRIHAAYGHLAKDLGMASHSIPELPELERLWQEGNS